ncbi:MAG: corrinoid ABC transporter substrate-binding protein [Methanoregula sp. PtaU1.Bin006]|uniref:ABC transporter substrate-binding protein n=1 Tax=Methanoregula sp. PtaU1.Bin006 TaxID=1811681 RepID=UPI0009C9042B|nr:ABC transporter substrate-binding protein [Methanoregula sp. PtaU1.Bin006]OPY32822.1 MAG: corrinoid ABC transporter substrate-binding protein [Methanoregula sp. PtaU1.Bin006]
MKRTIVLVTIVLVLGVILAGCTSSAGNAGATAPQAKNRTITDMAGRQIEIPDPVERTAFFGGPIGQVPYILGVEDTIVATSIGSKNSQLLNIMDPNLKNTAAPRQTNGIINIEELIKSNPQFVVAGNVDGAIVEKQTKIPVVYFFENSEGTAQQTKNEVTFIGYIYGKEDRAKNYTSYQDTILAMVKSRVADIPAAERKVLFNGYDANHLITYGGDSYMQERIETAGLRNAAQPINTSGTRPGIHAGLDQISMEQVLKWNPDIIVIDTGSPEDVYNDSKWASISAVKNHQVYRLPNGVFVWNRPTAESAVLHPLWMAKIAYPDRFADISLKDEVKKFYREIFWYDLTDEQANKILSGEYASAISAGKGQSNQTSMGNK